MRVLATIAAVAALASCSPQGAGQGGSSETETKTADASAADTGSVTAPSEDPAAANLAAAEAFLAENGKKAGVTTTASGLQYEVLSSGPADGPTPAPGQWVCVHYRGTLLDGTEFDSSYSRGEAAAFPSDALIRGWVEALQMMKPGDAWRLAIHPDLAYGERNVGPIPPNSALLFDVSLIRLLDGQPPAGVDCAAS